MMTHIFRIVASACMVVVTVAVAVPLFMLWPVARRIEVASGQLLECTYLDAQGQRKGNGACLQSQTLAITGSTRATMGAVAKAAPEIAQSIRAASMNSVSASLHTVETAKRANQLLVAAKGTLGELDKTLLTLNRSTELLTKDASKLLQSSDQSVQMAGVALQELTLLEKQLNRQIEAGAPEAKETLVAMHRILSDPAITATLGNIDSATENLAEVTKTMDISTRGLRKRAGQVKWVLEKVAGMLKFTLPIL
jgi:hypothetical protein